VTDTQPTIAQEVERYLRTGDTDPHHTAWPGGFLESAQRAHNDLRNALTSEVRRLAAGRTPRPLPETDTVALTRRKVEPMVRGLFPRVEQDAVLAMLKKSVVFLTSDNIERLLREHAYDSSAWDLANLYLASLGAELLGEEAPAHRRAQRGDDVLRVPRILALLHLPWVSLGGLGVQGRAVRTGAPGTSNARRDGDAGAAEPRGLGRRTAPGVASAGSLPSTELSTPVVT
jgi:hypothetical protein